MQKQSIVIAGGSGLVGQALLRQIDRSIYDVYILSRQAKESKDVHFVRWDTNSKTIDLDFVPDHIINLAGAGIADGLWTTSRRRELIDSRVNSAKTIAMFLSKHESKPKSYVSASAIGYYGDRGSEILTETSALGKGFLAECCKQWEDAAHHVGAKCERAVILRIGIVLSTLDGALPKMLMTSKLGVYNYFGNGSQFYSWIHIDDLCKMILTSIADKGINGTYNAVTPDPLTNKTFMQEIMKALDSHGLLLPVPTFGLRLAMGEMADVVLNSNRVSADKWKNIGFQYGYSTLDTAIKDVVSRKI